MRLLGRGHCRAVRGPGQNSAAGLGSGRVDRGGRERRTWGNSKSFCIEIVCACIMYMYHQNQFSLGGVECQPPPLSGSELPFGAAECFLFKACGGIINSQGCSCASNCKTATWRCRGANQVEWGRIYGCCSLVWHRFRAGHLLFRSHHIFGGKHSLSAINFNNVLARNFRVIHVYVCGRLHHVM